MARSIVRRILFVVGCCSLLLLVSTIPADANTGSWTVVVLPDTQGYTTYNVSSTVARTFRQQTQWIVNNVASERIVFVTHEGDVVQNGGAYSTEWQRADEAMDLLDGVVPYAVAIGNRDYETPNNRASGAASFKRYFGPQRYQGRSWYGGSSGNGLNHYQFFRGGNWTFLHLTLELSAPDTAINWAQSVLNKYPHLPTIVTTHSYQNDVDGRVTNYRFGGNSGEDIWRKLIKRNKQIFMVLNGHFCTNGDGERHQVSTNDAGMRVFEMVANYQCYPNGGNGYLRLIRFEPGQSRIRVQTYSPKLGKYLTDGDSAFSFSVNFAHRFGGASNSPTLSISAGQFLVPLVTH